MTGRTLAHYQVIEKLGQGGMGEVYRARDTKLARDVAIKVLPEALSQDRERLARFEREAQLLASLNHPNIAAIHGMETVDGAPFLVLEMVPGQSPAGPMPPEEAEAICQQIAEAIEAAHEKGIVHRDLTPANIKVTPEGQVKVLDFGLAKALAGDSTDASSATSPTLTVAATQAGVLMGTASYMSPEQARGRPAGRRADVWAFGCVYYELLTGRKAFDGDNISDILASVLKMEPDWPALPESTPPRVRRLLRLCLEKDPKKRLRDIGDAWLEAEAPPGGAPAPRPPSRPVLLAAFGIALLSATALAALAYVHFREPAPVTTRFQVAPPETATNLEFPLISPDGRRLAFVASFDGRRLIWIRPLDSLTARPLAGTDDANFPFWSPDGRSLAFFSGGKLKKIDTAGGPPQTLCDAETPGRGGTWNRDGTIVFVGGSRRPLERVSAAGGTPSAITTLEAKTEISHRWPHFLPDGKRFLYWSMAADRQKSGLILASLDDPPGATERRRLVRGDSMAVYSAGHLLFARDGTLMAQPFDLSAGRVSADAFPIVQQIGRAGGHTGWTAVSASTEGALAYRTGTGALSQLTWFDRNGKQAGLVGALVRQIAPKLSPDGRRVAVSRDTQTQPDIYLLDLARDAATRFTFHLGSDITPVWSPDGARIAYSSHREDGANLYWRSSSGAGAEELLYKSVDNKYVTDWSPDGRFLLYTSFGGQTGLDILALPLTGERKPVSLLETPFSESLGQFSPDGRWMAYHSDESGTPQVYVQGFPNAGGKFQVSTTGGMRARWRRDGREIYFVGADSKMMAVDVKASGTSLEIGRPRELFQTRMVVTTPYTHGFDVSGDGQRFLVNRSDEAEAASPLTVVMNWASGK